MGSGSSQTIKVISLRNLLATPDLEPLLNKDLCEFRCDKNNDEENFLHSKAKIFEELNKARTYLVYDDRLVKLLGYFTLSFKSIELSQVSSSKRKNMTAGDSDVETYAAFLIGHLAKNSLYAGELKGDILLQNAENKILEAQAIVGGRLEYVDCKDIESLKCFYTRNGFTYFNTSNTSGLLQYYKKL